MITTESTLPRKILAAFLILALSNASPWGVRSAAAKTGSRPAGELSFARHVALNGTAVISGVTVFNGSRLKTSVTGAATINLNKLGRVGLGPDTEMVLRFSEEIVGGELIAGRIVVNVPAGTKISVATTHGLVTSEGKQATMLAIVAAEGNTRVAATFGDAQVTFGKRVEYVGTSKEVSVGPTAATGSSSAKLPGPAGSSGAPSQAGGGGKSILLPLLVAAAGVTTAAIVATTLNRRTQPVSPSTP